MPSLAHKRGTRAQIDSAATLNGLRTGELYLISDEARLTVATAVNAHSAAGKQGEGDQESWIKLGADVSNSTVTMANVTGMSFNALANMTYVVDQRQPQQVSRWHYPFRRAACRVRLGILFRRQRPTALNKLRPAPQPGPQQVFVQRQPMCQ
jgi:hypothetical protein